MKRYDLFKAGTCMYSEASIYQTCYDGIIAGLKWLFSAHTAPFFGHLARLCSLKKPSRGQKIAHFSHHTDPSQQVY